QAVFCREVNVLESNAERPSVPSGRKLNAPLRIDGFTRARCGRERLLHNTPGEGVIDDHRSLCTRVRRGSESIERDVAEPNLGRHDERPAIARLRPSGSTKPYLA